jgi:hypothetical protein
MTPAQLTGEPAHLSQVESSPLQQLAFAAELKSPQPWKDQGAVTDLTDASNY